MFIFYVILLSVLALAFVALPFLRKKPVLVEVDRKAENLRAYNQQISELAQAFDAGEFTPEEKEQMENELKLRLLEDTAKADIPKIVEENKPVVPVAILSVALVIASIAFYYSQGNLSDIELQQAYDQAGTSAEAADRYLELLEDKMARNPDDIEGWWSLGQTLLNAGMYARSVPAFEKALMALERLPEVQDQDRSALMTSVVQARFLQNDRVLAEEDKRMLKQAIKFDSQNRIALGIKGSAAYEEGDFTEAVIQWRRLGQISSVDAQSVASAIAAAESRLLEAGLPIPENEFATGAADGPSIVVSLDLAPELAGKALNAKAIYVLARVAGGPPMPVAVKQLHTTILPVQILLDQNSKMGPMAGLTAGTTIEIVARLSMSGVANAAAGDLEVISEPMTLGEDEHSIALTINSVVQ